jgi:hypothetical protein
MSKPAALLSLAGLLASALAPATVHAAPPPAGAAVLSAAPRCAATAEAAARGIVGETGGNDTSAGFRVQDLVVDPVLRKAYVRVADCQDARKPLTLVALQASLALAPSVATPPGSPMTASLQSQAVTPGHDALSARTLSAPPAAATLIARGEAVEVVVTSSNVHMTLHGHATEPASAGAPLDVVLDAEPGTSEPPRHLHGIAAAAHRVEVQR